MAYLDNTVITVDAVLTKKGRERLGQGRNAFNISKFAVSDDEIDYSLYNTAHPLGSNYYSNIIESMPVLEAIPDESQTMMYKLLTLASNQPRMPYLTGIDSSYVFSPTESVPGSTNTKTLVPTTTSWNIEGTEILSADTFDSSLGYTMILFNENALTVHASGVAGHGDASTQQRVDASATSGLDPMINLSTAAIYVGKEFTLTAKAQTADVSTKITFYGNETGVTHTATVTVKST